MAMYKGKHCKQPSGMGRKRVALVASLLVVLALVCGGTVAYLTDSDRVANEFSPGELTTTVVENLEGSTKKDVQIQNTGKVDAWIRAEVAITWQDEAGNVYGTAPVEKNTQNPSGDYEIIWSVADEPAASKWVKGNDGFYYWTSPVAPTGLTDMLITSCTYDKTKAPEGYSLTVEVIGSGVQITPDAAFNDWTGGKSGLKVGGTADSKTLVKVS